MAERPCRLRLPGCLLGMLLMSAAMTAHAVGLGTPQVMSGFNEPLRARVALLDTGALRADDLRVALADSARWQAMEVARSADTDTLRLAVNGTPGHLYLDVRGSRALDTPWLDVVITLDWPEGELTPRLTLLPSTDPTTNGDETFASTAPPDKQAVRGGASAATGVRRRQEADRQTPASAATAQDSQRIAALEGKIDRLEQQLRASLEAQAALTTDMASLRASAAVNEAPVNERPDDTAELAALSQRQEMLETRLDQLGQQMPTGSDVATAASRPEAISPSAPSQTVAPALNNGAGRDNGFVWTWALAALLLMLAGAWAGLRRWRQRRYRLVSASELSPAMNSSAPFEGAVAAGKTEGHDWEAGMGGSEQNEARAAHRAQVEGICAEAKVFQRHGRREHAMTMLKEGLAQYPGDFQLMQALAALEATPDAHSPCNGPDDQTHQVGSMAAQEDSPELVPTWSLSSSPVQEAPLDPVDRAAPEGKLDRHVDFSTTPSTTFPESWALEEVAFEDIDTDNKRPDADRSCRYA